MKMTMQQYCLRWNNHQPNFISVFSTLLNSESLVDVTLSADGKHLQAHKLVLSACSSYFQSLFTMNPCQHPIVILKDVKFTDLKVIIDFMYYGEVNVSQDELPHILKTAEALKIKGLAEIPVEASLKPQNNTEHTEVLPASEPRWTTENQRHSMSPSSCPLSPASKRKRLRKTSSGSGSTEKHTSEEHSSSEVTLSSPMGMAVIKPDPGFSSNPSTPVKCSPRDSHSGFHENTETPSPHQMNLHIPQEIPMQQAVENTIDMSGTSTAAQTQTVTGYQWGIVDQHYPHFTQATLTLPQELQYTGAQAQLPQTYVCTSADGNASVPQQQQQQHVVTGAAAAPPTAVAPPIAVIPPKRKRTVNPQAQDNFIRALEAVRFGGIGFCKAARLYGVNNRTLWIDYKKRGYPVNRLSIKHRKAEHAGKVENAAATTSQAQSDGADENAATAAAVVHQHIHDQQELQQQTIQHTLADNSVSMIGGTFIDGRPVEMATPMLQRSRYFENGLVHTTPINFDQM